MDKDAQVEELSEEDKRKLEIFKDIPPQVLEYMAEEAQRKREEAIKAKRNEYLAQIRYYIPDLEDFPDMELDELEELLYTLKRAKMRENKKKAVKPPDAKRHGFKGLFRGRGSMLAVSIVFASVVLLIARIAVLG